jgi:hypothetical protein
MWGQLGRELGKELGKAALQVGAAWLATKLGDKQLSAADADYAHTDYAHTDYAHTDYAHTDNESW